MESPATPATTAITSSITPDWLNLNGSAILDGFTITDGHADNITLVHAFGGGFLPAVETRLIERRAVPEDDSIILTGDPESTEQIANQGPVADAGGDRSVNAGIVIRFDGGGSFDPDGEIVLYEWDLDADGKFESEGVRVTNVYYSAGSYSVRLRVTDNDGAADVDTAVVEVK